jgi:hypothetical protein
MKAMGSEGLDKDTVSFFTTSIGEPDRIEVAVAIVIAARLQRTVACGQRLVARSDDGWILSL